MINKIFLYSYRNGVSWWLSFCCRKKLPDLQLTSKLPGFCHEPATAAHCVRDGGKPVQSANVCRFWPAQISCCPQPKQSYPHRRPRNPRGTVWACYVRGLHTVLLLEYGVSLCLNVPFFQILSANEQACTLFDCTTSELIGKKLSSLLKKTSQVLEEALEQDFPLEDGTVATVTGKAVRKTVTEKHNNYNKYEMNSWIFKCV